MMSFPSLSKPNMSENALLPPPRTVKQIPGGNKVKDANGQALAYRETPC